MEAMWPEIQTIGCNNHIEVHTKDISYEERDYVNRRTFSMMPSYSRIYEGKFISGAIAGALTETDDIGYIASYPIYGVPILIRGIRVYQHDGMIPQLLYSQNGA